MGVEIEFGSVSARDAAAKVNAAIGGQIEEEDEHRLHIRDTGLGDFVCELDLQYAHDSGDASAKEGFESNLRRLFGNIGAFIVPCELVCPPVEIARLGELEALVAALRDAGASGTSANPFYAFGCQLNPEIASADADHIASVLKAYVLMSDWLRAVVKPDLTRRFTTFADPFPGAYERLVAAPDYWPGMSTLIDDYLVANPTRNRALDMLPLFAWIDGERVRAAVDDPLVKARPTFHYRLPNANVSEQDWSIVLEWNRWCVVERLADDRDLLAGMGSAFITNRDRLISENWAIRSTEWLLA